jgi:hypothetical protein
MKIAVTPRPIPPDASRGSKGGRSRLLSSMRSGVRGLIGSGGRLGAGPELATRGLPKRRRAVMRLKPQRPADSHANAHTREWVALPIQLAGAQRRAPGGERTSDYGRHAMCE